MDIKNAVTIITGASQGIGRVTALAFAEAGARLALAARSAGLLEALAAELRANGAESLVVPTDMRDRAQVAAMVEATREHFGRVDILINNAGQAVGGAVAEVDLEQARQVFELNLFGPLSAMQAVVPVMRRQGGGLIINISSNVSKMHIPGIGLYAATKYALNGMSGTARVELARDNIRVVTVYPGLTATNFGRNALRSPAGVSPPREGMPTPDPPELVARRILEAARDEPAEQYMSPELAAHYASVKSPG